MLSQMASFTVQKNYLRKRKTSFVMLLYILSYFISLGEITIVFDDSSSPTKSATFSSSFVLFKFAQAKNVASHCHFISFQIIATCASTCYEIHTKFFDSVSSLKDLIPIKLNHYFHQLQLMQHENLYTNRHKGFYHPPLVCQSENFRGESQQYR